MQSSDFHPHDALQPPSKRAGTDAVERVPTDDRCRHVKHANASHTDPPESTDATNPALVQDGRWG